MKAAVNEFASEICREIGGLMQSTATDDLGVRNTMSQEAARSLWRPACGFGDVRKQASSR